MGHRGGRPAGLVPGTPQALPLCGQRRGSSEEAEGTWERVGAGEHSPNQQGGGPCHPLPLPTEGGAWEGLEGGREPGPRWPRLSSAASPLRGFWGPRPLTCGGGRQTHLWAPRPDSAPTGEGPQDPGLQLPRPSSSRLVRSGAPSLPGALALPKAPGRVGLPRQPSRVLLGGPGVGGPPGDTLRGARSPRRRARPVLGGVQGGVREPRPPGTAWGLGAWRHRPRPCPADPRGLPGGVSQATRRLPGSGTLPPLRNSPGSPGPLGKGEPTSPASQFHSERATACHMGRGGGTAVTPLGVPCSGAGAHRACSAAQHPAPGQPHTPAQAPGRPGQPRHPPLLGQHPRPPLLGLGDS